MNRMELLEARTLFATLAPDVTFGVDGAVGPPDVSNGRSYFFDVIGRTDRGLLVSQRVYDPRTDSRTDTLQRLRSDGTVDPTFSAPTLPSETNVLGTGANVTRTASATDAQGRVLIARATSDNFVYVSRYRVDGTLDRGFGDKGMTRRRLPVTAGDRAFDGGVDIAALPDGSVIAAAGPQTYSTKRLPAAGLDAAYAFKLSAAGQFDDNYGTGGLATVASVEPQYGVTNLFGVDPQGRLVISTTSVGRRFNVTRYDASGSPDASFARGGTYTLRLTDFPQYERFAASLDPQGRVLIARSRSVATLTRLNDRGRVDPTYGRAGVVTIWDTFREQSIQGVVVAPGGGVTLLTETRTGDFSTTRISLVALRADGSRDAALGTAGVAAVATADEGAVLLDRLGDGNFLIKPSDYARPTKFAPIRPFALASATGTLTFFKDPANTADTTITIARRGSGTRVTYNGQSTDYAAGAVRRIEAALNDGTNIFDSSLDVPTTVAGGLGADYITTGDADDRILAAGEFASNKVPDGYGRINSGGGTDYINLAIAGRRGYDVDAGAGGGSVSGGQNGRGNITVTGRSGHWEIDVASGLSVNLTLAGLDARVRISGLSTVVDLAGVRQSNVEGSINNDRITTGPGRDRVYSFGGNDTIATGKGDDLIYGDLDLDPGVDGGAVDERRAPYYVGRNDLIDAGLGNDFIQDLYGNNTVAGGEGDDTISTGDGVDRVNGGVGRDRVRGGANDDVLYGDGSNDTLYGDAGDDRLDGGGGDDLLFAGSGDDVLLGNVGADRLYGESGRDRLFALHTTSGSNRLANLLDGGSGYDRGYRESDEDVLVGIESILF